MAYARWTGPEDGAFDVRSSRTDQANGVVVEILDADSGSVTVSLVIPG